MFSPLDAYRITLLFVLERAAFSGGNLHPLTRWWLEHAALWLFLCVAGWSTLAFATAVRAAQRRVHP
jgi:ABC-2 type transport system permease protein/Cu-processing system permease protein